MSGLCRFSITQDPLKYALVKGTRIDVILRRPVFDALRLSGGYCRHRKISIAHTGQIHRTIIAQGSIAVGVIRKRVIALMTNDVAVDRSNGL